MFLTYGTWNDCFTRAKSRHQILWHWIPTSGKPRWILQCIHVFLGGVYCCRFSILVRNQTTVRYAHVSYLPTLGSDVWSMRRYIFPGTCASGFDLFTATEQFFLSPPQKNECSVHNPANDFFIQIHLGNSSWSWIQLPPSFYLSPPSPYSYLMLSLEVKGNSTPKLRNVTEKNGGTGRPSFPVEMGPFWRDICLFLVCVLDVLEKAYETPNNITPWN